MSRISREDVERVAGLSRLALSPEEAEAMTRDLEGILALADSLAELDTASIDATAHGIPLETPMRADLPVEPMDPALAMANAPQSEGTAFRVPRVIEEH